VFAPAGFIAFGVLGAIGSLIAARLAGVRSSPNLPLYSSLRSSLTCLIGVILLSVPFFLMGPQTFSGSADWLSNVGVGGMLLASVSLFVAMEKGGYFLLDHFASRFILCRKKLVPWHMVRFLDTAAERLFLRKVGGGYIFVHRSILEYFADQSSKT
jgi:hypothetical protein